MKEILIDELKQLQLEILVKVDSFCNENGIRYFLDGGTLLGAVRHNGYIPWDDDIDIRMPRGDYNKFLSIFNGKVDNLVVCAPELNLAFYAPYANVFDKRTLLIEEYVSHRKMAIGVKIDIFPMDNLPADDNLRECIYKQSIRCNNICGIKNQKLSSIHGLNKIKLIIGKIMCLLVRFEKVQKKHINIMRKSNELSNGLFADNAVFPVYGPKTIKNTSVFPLTDIVFEGYHLKAPKDYDKYLRILYGDYMQLPPVEKRVAHHHFIAYWK